MEEKNETKQEPEVITFKEIVERNKNLKKEELFKLVLVCKNCSHKDLLKNFIRKKERDWNIEGDKPKPNYIPSPSPWNPSPSPDINPWKQPKPYKPYYKRYKCGTKQKSVSCLMLDREEYEDMFFCPKCKSSLVVLDPDFVRNNILRGMESE